MQLTVKSQSQNLALDTNADRQTHNQRAQGLLDCTAVVQPLCSPTVLSPSSRVQGLMLLILSVGEMYTENVRQAMQYYPLYGQNRPEGL